MGTFPTSCDLAVLETDEKRKATGASLILQSCMVSSAFSDDGLVTQLPAWKLNKKYNGCVSNTAVLLTMPLCIDIQSLLLIAFAVILIQQSASPTNAQSNFALYQEITVSSNNTCGLQEEDEFCVAIDQHRNCRHFDLCNTRCFFADTSPGKLDLVATGMFHGEVTYKNIMSNTSQCKTFIYL